MSIYPDWIGTGVGVDVGSGVVLVEGYNVSLEENNYDVAIELGFEVTLDDNDYEVEYG
tara:strand:- start:307 stop:480 length:174 start_codon:yes stop_codon:yes gene_type:complete